MDQCKDGGIFFALILPSLVMPSEAFAHILFSREAANALTPDI